jgi:anti-sigma factor RsiW
MNVTREVIYDLLPGYFAGEASADTRALVDEFFATDPEFGRMAARFHSAAEQSRGAGRTGADREREAFNQARSRLGLRQAAIGWACGALLAFFLALVTGNGAGLGFRHPGFIIGVVFGAMAAATGYLSTRADAGRWYRMMVDGTE